ncbi:MAG: HAD-IA family hydrolase [Candidatus Marinimicrobia bacterium]|nr:HAD-IA family hydrolase [Candidatus Neomarinimicrobiota bacterium]MBT3630410.1 HAD-IA family hydrolase [Candidatus Neomarinimicrobiota bacterium]MBT3823729.1 HAD-IA family hydrolase [Candidatus Neomarinimicrobiota bacterium]MBT4131922.1 HAD-IA family hydrolase [Candidatus Neomarinimicrobiota bacterium]MBT4294648.1 HAD-IA family hydrolase [Candidatus Neomarinimicrobiota bacterium]
MIGTFNLLIYQPTGLKKEPLISKQTTVEALIFDLGGVLIDIDFEQVFKRWVKLSELTISEIRQRFSMDEAYKKHERGEFNAEQYFSYLRELLHLKANDGEIARGWNSIFVGEIPATMDYIYSAKAHLPCYAFTNSNPTHQASWGAAYPNVVQAFDQIFVSSDMGLRKPEPAAFSAISTAIGVRLEGMLFFDDTVENIVAAQAMGIQTVLVKQPSDIKQALISREIL